MHAGMSLCKPGGTNKAKVQKETTAGAVASAILHTSRFARFSYCTRGVTRVTSCSICDKCYNVVRVLTCAVMTYSECFKLCCLAQDCKPAMFTCMAA